jgi:integral membrane protein (TIGR01906 family)
MAGVDLTPAERLAGLLTAVATAVVIVAVAIVPFLSPAWVSFEQGRAQAEAWTGFTTAELGAATDAILADLVVGPPDFDVVIGGEPVLTERERSHMRDVRGVFAGFAAIALAAAAGLAAGFAMARRRGHPERAWLAIRNGARWLAVGIVAAGVIALVAFDAAFEVFHRLFFSGGSYTFDPGTERLVQLFPFTFWSETSMAVGAVIFVLSLAVAFIAGRRLRADAGPVANTAPGVAAADAAPDAAR